MYKLLLVASTEFEIMQFIDDYCEPVAHNYYHLSKNNNIAVLITGIGIANMALHLSSFFSKHTVEASLNVGFCGSFSKEFTHGCLLKIETDCFADFGIFDETGTIQPFEKYIKTKEVLKYLISDIKPNNLLNIQLSKLSAVKGITVNACTNNSKRAQLYITKHQAQTESMEGASFYLTCNAFNIQCVQIRAVSNHIPGRSADNWYLNEAKKSIHKFIVNDLLNKKSKF